MSGSSYNTRHSLCCQPIMFPLAPFDSPLRSGTGPKKQETKGWKETRGKVSELASKDEGKMASVGESYF